MAASNPQSPATITFDDRAALKEIMSAMRHDLRHTSIE